MRVSFNKLSLCPYALDKQERMRFFSCLTQTILSLFRALVVEVLAKTTPPVIPVLQVKDIAVYAPLDSLVKTVKMVNKKYPPH